MIYRIIAFFSIFLFFNGVNGQIFNDQKHFTELDTLRGSNTTYRDWWNVLQYDIEVEPNFEKRSIQGKVNITFTVLENYSHQELLQIDLQEPLKFTDIAICENMEGIKGKCNSIDLTTQITKKGNAYLIHLNDIPKFQKNQTYSILCTYEGYPKIAKNAPWDGGWVFTKDDEGRPWMSVACQGLGASVWYPCKDYQGDEPDNGAQLSIITTNDLVAVANGRLQETQAEGNDKTKYTWKVENPINNYNIVPNIGHYINFTDTYSGEKGTLDLSYWVIDYNVNKAKKQFQQVQPMLKAFEYWMGPYPFYEDSFKLIETPYLGMEHQSGIAYGNQYKNGYLGSDLSGTGVGLNWDFIIIHESGHEWYGNNITTQDVADMWVQEGFTAYSETLFTEEFLSKDEAFQYTQGTKQSILNDIPIIGPYGVNQEGSGDMYYKASNMIHTLRMLMEDDQKFRQMLRDMNAEFYHQTVTTQQIENYISKYTDIDLTAFFNQYLRTTQIPVLVFKKNKKKIEYRYENVVSGFDMPVQLDNNQWIYPTTKWKILKNNKNIPSINPNFLVIQKQ